jgi:cytoskeletal protein CcmA (bactofilin family)
MMFKNKKAGLLNPNSTDTVIGEGSVFEGRIRSEAGVRIEGSITGDVESAGDVTIGEKGVVKSNVTARNIVIAGSVHGNVTAKEKLTIMSSGQLTGNASTASLIIEDGAVFTGSSRMDGKNAPGSSEFVIEKEAPKTFSGGFGDSMAM